MKFNKYAQSVNQTVIIFEGPDQCGKTEIGNKLSKILLVELNRIQSPTVATDGGGDIDARIAEAKAEGKAEAERENAEDDAAEAVAAEKEEKDDKITAAEVGLGVGAVGVLGYFAANALGFLE